ncbi:hypothetical protein HZC09_05930 [Candidatus Micrarchaeota archaeon]|nr:hypothetical protein [Candidatus Micrarchaeota archaeon]
MVLQALIIAAVLALVALGIVGVDFLGFADFSQAQEVTWTTSSGVERVVVLPKIPGLQPLRQERGRCNYASENVYDIVRDYDISGTALDTLRKAFVAQDWTLADERTEDGRRVLEFYTEKAGEPERMTVETRFEKGKGTFFTFRYRWPPCSSS